MAIPAQGHEKLNSARTLRPNAKSRLALFHLEVKVFSFLIKAEEAGGRSGEENLW